jgi:hypothetical protein
MDTSELFQIQGMIAVVTGGGTGIVSSRYLVLIRIPTVFLNNLHFQSQY